MLKRERELERSLRESGDTTSDLYKSVTRPMLEHERQLQEFKDYALDNDWINFFWPPEDLFFEHKT